MSCMELAGCSLKRNNISSVQTSLLCDLVADSLINNLLPQIKSIKKKDEHLKQIKVRSRCKT